MAFPSHCKLLIEGFVFVLLIDDPDQLGFQLCVPGVFSFKVKDARIVEPLLRHIRLIAFAESLGGVESLMTYPAIQTHADIPAEIRDAVGVDDRLLRFSVGIEHEEDLIADLGQALAAAVEEVQGGER